MNSRMKLLLGGSIAVFGLYGLDSTYRGWIEEPTRTLNVQLDSLTSDLSSSEQSQFQSQKTSKRLDAYAHRALPADPQRARSLYQEWLLALVDKHKILSSSIDPTQTVPLIIASRTKKGKKNTIGHRIGFSLRGQTTLAQLGAFLDEYRKAGHLHKIRTIAMNPIGNDGRIDLSISLEVLSLSASKNKDSLGDWIMKEEIVSELAPKDPLVRRNLFARGFAKALQEIELRAITLNRLGIAEAWFAVDAKGSVKTAEAGAKLPVPLHEIDIVEVLADRVLLNINQEQRWIRIGESIGEVLEGEPSSEENQVQ